MPGLERQADRRGLKSRQVMQHLHLHFLQWFSSASGDISQLRFNFKPSIFSNGTMKPCNKIINSMQSDKASGSYHALSIYYLHLQMNYTGVHNTEDGTINMYPC